MNKDFTPSEIDMFRGNITERDEVYYETRKGVPLSKYVFEVLPDQEYWGDEDFVRIPEELVGFWIMSYADDLRYSHLEECIKKYSWERCEMKEVVKTEWVVKEGV
jgi:hypothetical protein